MSLILKGIDLPKKGTIKLEIEPNGTVWAEGKDWQSYTESAIQIPKGHGRVIDVDRLIRDEVEHLLYHLPNGDTAIPKVDIDNAPTILAEE